MGVIASPITSLTIVYSTVYSDADQRKHQSSSSLAFVWGIYRGPVYSPHKWPVTRKMFPFDDVIMVINGSNNHLAPRRLETITWTSVNVLPNGLQAKHFCEIWITGEKNHVKKILLNMSSVKCLPVWPNPISPVTHSLISKLDWYFRSISLDVWPQKCPVTRKMFPLDDVIM